MKQILRQHWNVFMLGSSRKDLALNDSHMLLTPYGMPHNPSSMPVRMYVAAEVTRSYTRLLGTFEMTTQLRSVVLTKETV